MQTRHFLALAACLAMPAGALAQTRPLAPPSPGQAAQEQAGSAEAAAGTEAGARSLQSALAAYLSPQAFDLGFLTVAPDPAGYRITFKLDTDFGTAGSSGSGTRGHMRIAPYSVLVSRQPDGNWFVRSMDGFSSSLSLDGPTGRTAISSTVGSASFSGIFSPAIGGFLSSSATADKMVVTQRTPQSETFAEFGPQSMEAKAVPAEDGSVDVTFSQTGSDLKQTILSADPAHPERRVPIRLAAKDLSLDGKAAGLRSRPMLDLWAFLLAHQDREKIVASQDELRARLRDLLPAWKSLDLGETFGGVSVSTPFGGMTADRFRVAVKADGITTAGAFRYIYGLEGMSFASPSIPAWADPLIPHDLTLGLGARNLDLDAAARIAIDDFDLAREKPLSDAAEKRIAAVFHDHVPRFTIEPSRLKAADYEVKFSGELSLQGSRPATKLDITATGVDNVIALLQKAGSSDPRAFQAVGFLSLAKGFAGPSADGSTHWLIETGADGSVKINGMQIKGPSEPDGGKASESGTPL
ncbi:hypothetical protein [Jiella sp. M17.18]|uniref:hypothetical protein n=1 Tax=Jiella sp. M17.18 TaxID=3234247 RepID=UPI0034DE4CFC